MHPYLTDWLTFQKVDCYDCIIIISVSFLFIYLWHFSLGNFSRETLFTSLAVAPELSTCMRAPAEGNNSCSLVCFGATFEFTPLTTQQDGSHSCFSGRSGYVTSTKYLSSRPLPLSLYPLHNSQQVLIRTLPFRVKSPTPERPEDTDRTWSDHSPSSSSSTALLYSTE